MISRLLKFGAGTFVSMGTYFSDAQKLNMKNCAQSFAIISKAIYPSHSGEDGVRSTLFRGAFRIGFSILTEAILQ
jgi:hypothetical protein